jgi:phage gp36-like protein
MSNAYCTSAQFFTFYDIRLFSQLSNDSNSRNANQTTIQFLLDVQASELESYLAGRFALPLPSVPMVLTKWVAASTADRLFARRSDQPEKVKADAEWADKWIKELVSTRVSLPNIERAVGPELGASNFADGRSQFDNIKNFDRPASESSTSGGA